MSLKSYTDEIKRLNSLKDQMLDEIEKNFQALPQVASGCRKVGKHAVVVSSDKLFGGAWSVARFEYTHAYELLMNILRKTDAYNLLDKWESLKKTGLPVDKRLDTTKNLERLIVRTNYQPISEEFIELVDSVLYKE